MNHLRLHNDVKCFQCYICHKSFGTKHNLQRHLQVHIKQGIDVDVKNIIVDSITKAELDNAHNLELKGSNYNDENHIGKNIRNCCDFSSVSVDGVQEIDHSKTCIKQEILDMDSSSDTSIFSTRTRNSDKSDSYKFSSEESSFKTTMAKERKKLYKRWKKTRLSLLGHSSRKFESIKKLEVKDEPMTMNDTISDQVLTELTLELNGVCSEVDGVLTIYVNATEKKPVVSPYLCTGVEKCFQDSDKDQSNALDNNECNQITPKNALVFDIDMGAIETDPLQCTSIPHVKSEEIDVKPLVKPNEVKFHTQCNTELPIKEHFDSPLHTDRFENCLDKKPKLISPQKSCTLECKNDKDPVKDATINVKSEPSTLSKKIKAPENSTNKVLKISKSSQIVYVGSYRFPSTISKTSDNPLSRIKEMVSDGLKPPHNSSVQPLQAKLSETEAMNSKKLNTSLSNTKHLQLKPSVSQTSLLTCRVSDSSTPCISTNPLRRKKQTTNDSLPLDSQFPMKSRKELVISTSQVSVKQEITNSQYTSASTKQALQNKPKVVLSKSINNQALPPHFNDSYNRSSANTSYINTSYTNTSYTNTSHTNTSYTNTSYTNSSMPSAFLRPTVVPSSSKPLTTTFDTKDPVLRNMNMMDLVNGQSGNVHYSSNSTLNSTKSNLPIHPSVLTLNSTKPNLPTHPSVPSLNSTRPNLRMHPSVPTLNSTRANLLMHPSVPTLNSTKPNLPMHSSVPTLNSTKPNFLPMHPSVPSVKNYLHSSELLPVPLSNLKTESVPQYSGNVSQGQSRQDHVKIGTISNPGFYASNNFLQLQQNDHSNSQVINGSYIGQPTTFKCTSVVNNDPSIGTFQNYDSSGFSNSILTPKMPTINTLPINQLNSTAFMPRLNIGCFTAPVSNSVGLYPVNGALDSSFTVQSIPNYNHQVHLTLPNISNTTIFTNQLGNQLGFQPPNNPSLVPLNMQTFPRF